MGINAAHLRLLKPYLSVDSLLSLSYPDMVMTGADVEEILGIVPETFTDNGTWHDKAHPLPETREVLTKFGIKNLRFVDIYRSRGCEEITDLNEPCDLGKHDLVIDFGTTEHCFNVAQALKNAAEAVRLGGVIFHSVPMVMPNHGFWNYSPTALVDFYEQNGWMVELVVGTGKGEKPHQIQQKKRFVAGGDWALVVAARRLKMNPMLWPTQSKYLLNRELKAS